MIKNLALKGGGVLGIAYVGALKELENRRIYEGLKRVSGTSAGAMVAAMIAIGFTPEDIEKKMHEMHFKQFKWGFNPFRLFSSYGLYSGDYILEFAHSILDASGKLPKNATFRDLAENDCKELYVFAANIDLHTIQEFSFSRTPDCIVAEAIRASMSIPLFFKAWQFTSGNHKDYYFVDGGLVYNYPLSFFDNDARFGTTKDSRNESMGLYLESKLLFESNNRAKEKGNISKERLLRPNKKLSSFRFFSYLKFSFATLLNAQGIDFMEDNHLVRRTIFINDLGFSPTDFNLDNNQKNLLVNSGLSSAIRYFTFKKETESKSPTLN